MIEAYPQIEEVEYQFQVLRTDEDDLKERRLLFAILERAIIDIVAATLPPRKDGRAKQRSQARQTIAQQAKNWINSTDRSGPTNYERICETLGYDPNMLRKPDVMRRVTEAYRRNEKAFL